VASIYHTTGIVLSQREHKEADRWYSVFTRDRGKIEVLAKGGHKPLAKLTPHLEMPAVVELMVVNGRQYDTVAGVERRVGFANVYGDLSRLLLARHALYLTDIGTRPHEMDVALYDLLVRWLTTLDAASTVTQERAGFLLGAFSVKLLSLVGYRPEFLRCLVCRDAIAPGAYRWSALKGGVACATCVERNQEQWFAARTISDDALKLLRYALAEPFEAHLRPHLPGELLTEYHEAIESLLISHFPVIPGNSLRSSCLV
jgi:DNA repair protein RecO (recombination protein O)